MAALWTGGASAQPAPSFLASCSELRAAIKKLGRTGDELITIEVQDALTSVSSAAGGALVYMTMCKAPDPQVLCVTYQTNGRQAGERTILTGAFIARGPDHVQLDPCLSHDAEN